jgi:hypothetical protein
MLDITVDYAYMVMVGDTGMRVCLTECTKGRFTWM